MPKHAALEPIDVTCSLFHGIRRVVTGACTVPWDDFVDGFEGSFLAGTVKCPENPTPAQRAAAKKALPGFVLAPVDGERNDANTGEHTALAIDVDAIPDNDLEGLLRAASAFKCFVYETPSSTPDAFRVRVVAALACPLPVTSTAAARRELASHLGLDPVACGTSRAEAHSQVMFAGRFEHTAERGFARFDGDVFVPAPAPVKARKAPPSAPPPRSRVRAVPSTGGWDFEAEPFLEAISAACPPAGIDADRHALSRALGGWLSHRGYTPAAIASAVRRAIPSDRPDERAEQARDAAERVRAGEDAPGWQSLQEWARAHGNRTTLKDLEKACRDPREPEGFTGIWSEAWARYWPKFAERYAKFAQSSRVRAMAAANRERKAPLREANLAAFAEAVPGLDGLECDDDGKPFAHQDNVQRCVRHFLEHALAEDVTTGQTILTETVRLSGARAEPDTLEAGRWQDVYTSRIQALMNRLGMRACRKGDVQDAIAEVASNRKINVHGDWLRGLAAQWDGVPRIDTAMSEYWRAADDPVSRAVSRIMFLSIAARGMTPGEQVDTVPVLIGEQGCGKSQSLRALLMGANSDFPTLPYGGERRLGTSGIDMHSDRGASAIRGHLVWELGELASVRRADVNVIKDFISRRWDTFRPAYAREEKRYDRTVVFVATVNPDQDGSVVINYDPTGGRRWLPVHVGDVDLYGLEQDGPQLLGEAAARVLAGERWHPTDAEKVVLAPAVADATDDTDDHDPWIADIEAWAKRKKPGEECTVRDVLHIARGAVPIETSRIGHKEILHAARVLRRIGFRKKHTRAGAVWVK